MVDPEVETRIESLVRAQGIDYKHLIEQRRERERVRKRVWRKRRQTPGQRECECARKRTARQRQTPEQREREKQRERTRNRKKPRSFLAVDGEGGGIDELGRQNYFLMCAAGQSGEEYLCHREGKPLSTRDCLEFVLSLPADKILVAFGLGYDTTQILRGICIGIRGQRTLRRILNPPRGKNGPCYTYWGDYAISYQQGQYFRVARIDRNGPKPAVVKGSCRTIYETRGFFHAPLSKRSTIGVSEPSKSALLSAQIRPNVTTSGN